MAEENAGEEQTEEGGGSKKGLIIMIVVVLLAIGASVAGTLYFVGGSSEPEVVVEAEPVRAAAVYYQMRPAFIVNYVTTSKPRYLQAELSVMSRSPSVIEAVVDHNPLARSTVLEVLNAAEFEVLRTQEGKVALLEELTESLNSALAEEFGGDELEAVLLTNFVLQ